MAHPPDHSNTCHCINLRQASRSITRLYDAALAESGLKVTQYSLLAKISRRGSASLQALANEANLDRSTLGRNIRVLQRSGYVTITEDRNDKRFSRIELTALGTETTETARKAWVACQTRIETAMGSEFQHQLNGMIAALARLEPDLEAYKDTSQ